MRKRLHMKLAGTVKGLKFGPKSYNETGPIAASIHDRFSDDDGRMMWERSSRANEPVYARHADSTTNIRTVSTLFSELKEIHQVPLQR